MYSLYFFVLYFSQFVSLQNGSGWQHGTADSSQSKTETAAGTTGVGPLVHSLPADIQGNPQIYSLQLHSVVWCSTARQMDNLFHGGKVMINCCRENTLDLELINEVDQQPSIFLSVQQKGSIHVSTGQQQLQPSVFLPNFYLQKI